MSDLLDLRIGEFLDRLSASGGSPGAGSAAALVAATAAAVVAMAARASVEEWEDAAGIAAQAEAIRRKLQPLAQADAEALEEALERLAAGGGDEALGEALERAAEIPLRIVEASADVAELAAYASPSVRADVRADAVAAAMLAEAAARTCASLVEVNLATVEGDARLERARALAAACRRAAERAAAATA